MKHLQYRAHDVNLDFTQMLWTGIISKKVILFKLNLVL